MLLKQNFWMFCQMNFLRNLTKPLVKILFGRYLLGVETHLLTAFGDDVSAQKLAASCGELGIDISHALQVPGGWLIIGFSSIQRRICLSRWVTISPP